MPKALFDLGQIVATPASIEAVKAAGYDPVQLFARHVTGDWGDLPQEDVEENELSLEKGFRLFSAYKLETGDKVYVITEWNRSATTLYSDSEPLSVLR